MKTRSPQSPSWKNRPWEPADLPSLLEWLEQVAEPHIRILALDRCLIADTTAGNSCEPNPLFSWSAEELASKAGGLWDETCRACDWLADNGYHDAPVRPAETSDPAESLRQYQLVRQYLRSQPSQSGLWSKQDGPTQWAKKFGFSVDTLMRRFEDGTIRHKKLSTKSYQIHVDDLKSYGIHVDDPPK